jgi:hypothetical protein
VDGRRIVSARVSLPVRGVRFEGPEATPGVVCTEEPVEAAPVLAAVEVDTDANGGTVALADSGTPQRGAQG